MRLVLIQLYFSHFRPLRCGCYGSWYKPTWIILRMLVSRKGNTRVWLATWQWITLGQIICKWASQHQVLLKILWHYMRSYEIWVKQMLRYGDVIMSTIASQLTNVPIVYSTVCLNADQRKHQSSTLLAFVRGIHRWPRWIPRTKGQWRGNVSI